MGLSRRCLPSLTLVWCPGAMRKSTHCSAIKMSGMCHAAAFPCHGLHHDQHLAANSTGSESSDSPIARIEPP